MVDDFEAFNNILNEFDDKNPKHAKTGLSGLHWAAIYGRNDMFIMISKAVNEKSPRSYNGETPLHLAARYNRKEVCKTILNDYTIEENPKDNNGSTPLHEAAKFGHLGIAKLLLRDLTGRVSQKEW